MSGGTQLVRYDAMCRAIAEAHAVDEVKDIRDKARAIEMYARQAQNKEAEERAREIRIRAERKCGEMLTTVGRNPGLRTDLTSSPRGTRSFAEQLQDSRISPKQAENWQKLAAVPEDLFEEALAEPNVSTAGIIMRQEVLERGPLPVMGNNDALWVWGTLEDFERLGILDADPRSMFTGIHDHMRTTMLELAPRVSAWLWRLCNE